MKRKEKTLQKSKGAVKEKQVAKSKDSNKPQSITEYIKSLEESD